MRRLLVNGRFLTRPQTGVDRCATELVRALADLVNMRRPQVVSLDVAVPGDAPSDEQIRGHLRLPGGSEILRSKLSGYAWEQLALAALRPGSTLLSLCNIGPVMRRNQLVLIHDAQIYDAPESYGLMFQLTYKILQPRLAKRANWVATVSNFSRSRLESNGVTADRPVELLYNGADHITSFASDARVLERHCLEPKGYLLAIGSPAAHKNIARLTKACEARRDRKLPLVIAGMSEPRSAGPNGGSCEGSHSARYIGRVSDNELKALYENAVMFLFPSLTEGFGLPPLEAMACKCPVIASTAGAIPEICGDAAVYCDPRDTQLWTREIEALQADHQRLARLGHLGQERAAAFRWESSAARLLELLSL